MKVANIFLALFLIFPFMVSAQLQHEYAWRTNQVSDKKKDAKIFQAVERNGYKSDLDSMKKGKVAIKVQDPVKLSRLFRKKTELVIRMYGGDTLILSGLEAKEQLLLQYLGSSAINDGGIDTVLVRKEFSKILKGKLKMPKGAPDIWTLDFGCTDYFDQIIVVDFERRGRLIGELGFLAATGDIARMFPQNESDNCREVDRYLKFITLKDIKDHYVVPVEYSLQRGKRITKEFVLTFDQNKHKYKREEVEAIRKYLEDSSLSISRAFIRGMSSIEGDSLQNARLQRQRAEVLWEDFLPYAEKGVRIEGDYKEGWIKFRSQMLEAKIHDFDSMTIEEIRELFNDSRVRRKYESFLKDQRVTRLRLTLYKEFTAKETILLAARESRKLFNEYLELGAGRSTSVRNHKAKKRLGKILGIEEALMNEVRDWKGSMTGKDVVNSYPFDKINSQNLAMARFYYLKSNYERGNYPVIPNTRAIINAANDVVLPSVKSAYFSNSNKPLRMAVDIQLIAYRLIKKGCLDGAFFHELAYDDIPLFYHLNMNKLYYNQHYLHLDEKTSVTTTGETVLTPSQYKASRYYYYLKKWLIDGDDGIRTQVVRSDNMFFFDIYDLLYYNICLWNPYFDEYYDDEVSVTSMAELLNNLMPTRLCPEDKYDLALDFHRKVIISSIMENKATDQFRKSYDFVVKYYKKRTHGMDAKEIEQVARQLVLANSLFYNNRPIEDAYDILLSHFRRNDLDNRGEEFFAELSYATGNDEKNNIDSVSVFK